MPKPLCLRRHETLRLKIYVIIGKIYVKLRQIVNYHEVLRVRYCGRACVDRLSCSVHHVSSIVNFLTCVRSRGHIFSPILMKHGQNVFLIASSDEFEDESYQLKN